MLPALGLVLLIGIGGTGYSLRPTGHPPIQTAFHIDFSAIERALLPIQYTAEGIRYSDHTEHALRAAASAVPDPLSAHDQERILWLTAQVHPLHGQELSRLLQQYLEYGRALEQIHNKTLSGHALLKKKVQLQNAHFGWQAARGLFPQEHALLERLNTAHTITVQQQVLP